MNLNSISYIINYHGTKLNIMMKHYIKICLIACMLILPLMTSFNAIMVPKANGEMYHYHYYYPYYPSNENLISKAGIVENNTSNINSDGNGHGNASSISTNGTGSTTNGGRSTCTISAPLNANSSGLNVNVLPPKILMNYAGIVYPGNLSEAKYRAGINFPELHIRPQNISANLPSNIVHIKNGSCIQFIIVGTPKLLPPSSLAVTAYHAINGTAAAVLDATDYDNTIFRMNLNSGNYILIAVATWLPGSEDVTGYVIYKFVVSIE